MTSISPAWRTLALIGLAALTLAACRSAPDAVERSGPEILYARAKSSLDSQDFNNAIRIYEALTARYPFAPQSRQARLDLIYAYYRGHERESATDAADQFIRENPTHPRVDYAWYIKGLVDFERTPNALERLFRADLNNRPPQTAERAFAAFRTVLERYPRSAYAADSRQRMIYLRNRLADYELNVARYYFKRGAYVAAAQRSKQVVERYDGAPSVPDALAVLVASYEKLNLSELAEQTRHVYVENFGEQSLESHGAAKQKKRWWKPWQ
ncbi:MAG: outer membrane protein assembly factor BamD [Steroidobacteraceae bacterium]